MHLSTELTDGCDHRHYEPEAQRLNDCTSAALASLDVIRCYHDAMRFCSMGDISAERHDDEAFWRNNVANIEIIDVDKATAAGCAMPRSWRRMVEQHWT